MARPLGLITVAEWVPDEEAAAMLHDRGRDFLRRHRSDAPRPGRRGVRAAPTRLHRRAV